MLIIAKKGYKRRNCRSWLVVGSGFKCFEEENRWRQICEFRVVGHMFKKREFVGFRFWSWEKKNYLAGKVQWSLRWLYFGWNSLHFQCVDPCEIGESWLCNLWMKKLHIHTPIHLNQTLRWFYLKFIMLAWRDGSAVTSALYSCRWPGSVSQHLFGDLQLSRP